MLKHRQSDPFFKYKELSKENLLTILTFFRIVKNPLTLLFAFTSLNRRYKIQFRNNFEIKINRSNILNIYYLCYLISKGWKITQWDSRSLLFIKSSHNLVLPKENFLILIEDLDLEYHRINFKGATVVDIGGFLGETAVFFKNWGAKKILIYEPITENHKYIKLNIQLNRINAKVFPMAVTDKFCTTEVEVDERTIGSPLFGLKSGNEKIILKSCTWNQVLKNAVKENTGILKVDCEGCEKFLLDADTELVEKIPVWIIEVHNEITRTFLIDFFKKLNYKYRHTNKKHSALIDSFVYTILFTRSKSFEKN